MTHLRHWVSSLLVIAAFAPTAAAAQSDTGAGKCGAFVVYNSSPYPREHYPDMPDEDIWSWTWDHPTAQAALDAAKGGCLKRWAKKNVSVDQAEYFCGRLAGIFCTDKAALKGWGVDADSHNRCGALAKGDDHITYSHHYSGPTHMYRVGMGPTKKAAGQDALRKCRDIGTQARYNPVSNCRLVPRTTVCNSRSGELTDRQSETMTLDASERQRVQAALAAEGFDPGPADGVFGRKTRRAIQAWQRSNGYAASGELTRRQAEALLDGKAPLVPPGPNWILAENQPCQLYNPEPRAGETVTWSGGCENGKAAGEGRQVWRTSKGTAYLEGRMRDGYVYGTAIVTYFSGRRYACQFRDGRMIRETCRRQ